LFRNRAGELSRGNPQSSPLVCIAVGISDEPRWKAVIYRLVEDPTYRAELIVGSGTAGTGEMLPDEERQLARSVALLCGYPTFSGISPLEIGYLIESASVRQYATGAILVHEGGVEDEFFIILQGQVAIMVADELGALSHAASLSAGDFFGEIAPLFDTQRTATATATAPTQLAVIPGDRFREILESSEDLRDRIEASARRRLFSTSAVTHTDVLRDVS